MSKQQGMKEVFELEMFTNQDPSTSYHIFQKLGTPWPYFVSLQGDNNILGPLFRDTQHLMDLREKDLLQSIKCCVSLKRGPRRSEEHTSELQSHIDTLCRLLLKKKKNMR